MFSKLVLSICLLLSSSTTLGQESSTSSPWPEDAIVDAGELGKIQGAYTYTSPNGKRFFWFAGIHYADIKSYTGENRFRPSSLNTGPLSDNPDKPYLAVNPLIFCPQRDIFYRTNTNMSDLGSVMTTYRKSLTKDSKDEFKKSPRYTGDEECLVINVNTPKIPREGDEDTSLLPVLFFVHGGSFDSIWGGVFGGHRFINRDVVVVSINYRLGLLGSLNLEVDQAPGNAAMYDVITALTWVQKYIHHFGGDKDSVTISGHSAGSVMVTHLMTSPLMKESNLFHKVIGLSGSSVSAWATCTNPLETYLRTAEIANCTQSSDHAQIAECMREKSIEELMDVLNKWEDEDETKGRFGFDAKIPSVQNPSSIPNTPVFMDETPLNVFLQGKQKNVPVMMGAARHDGSFVMESTYNHVLQKGDWLTNMTKLRNEFFPLLLGGLGMEDTTGGAMIHAMASTYLKPAAMNSDNFTNFIPGMIDIHSVIAFKAGAYNLVELHSKLNADSYYFAFDYYGLWTVDGGPVIPGGVGHIDSVFYLFQAFPLFVWPNDLQVSKRFVDYWINFATYGNPNGPPDSSRILFPPFDPHTHTYLIINGTDKIGYNCRDSWVDNSLEIKDHKRPGWTDFTLSPPSDPTMTTTTQMPDTNPTSTSTSGETNDPNTSTSVTSTPTTTTIDAISTSSTTEQDQGGFANINKPSLIICFIGVVVNRMIK